MLQHLRLQVATPRVRTAVKADIPHVEDHVSKLHSVGAQTQQKLQDVSAACEAAGVYGVKLPHNSVSKGDAVAVNQPSLTEVATAIGVYGVKVPITASGKVQPVMN